ncbi:hypothetical protein NMG29_35780 [Streptomyces cocklensis]|nr:hypothetical protein [Actinacidiphila cocklensis]MDD1063472.1 hypothetical protein [Actinacidiphila cocklensis]
MVGISTTHTAHPASACPVTPPYSGTGRPPVSRYPDLARSVKIWWPRLAGVRPGRCPGVRAPVPAGPAAA